MQRLEGQRSLLSKQISLVRELEALGSAMASHPLNTLSQRYAVYRKKRSDVDMIKNILMEKAVESERMMDDYLSFAEDSSSGRINNSLMDNKSNYGSKITVASEFDLIKDFLENSNQGQTHMQSEQLRKELDASILQQRKVIATSHEALVQYYNVAVYYPHDHIQNHRFAKYSQWCRSLIADKSPESVRHVAIAYHKYFGDASTKEHLADKIVGFGFRLQAVMTDVNYQRELARQRCQQLMELLSMDRNFSAVKGDFREFVRKTPDAPVAVSELTTMVKRLLTIEASTLSTSEEHLRDLNINERWYIDEMMLQTSFLSNIGDVLFDTPSGSPRKSGLYSNSLECFKAVTESFETFNRLKNDFQLNIIPQTLRGIISGEKSVLEMISMLSSIQNVTIPLAELAAKLQEDLYNGIHKPTQKGILRAAELTDAYNNMVIQFEASVDNSIGKQIFMSLHGQFEDMARVAKTILGFDKALNALPDEWSSIEELTQSRSLLISPMRTTICMTLHQIFLVKRIQVMIDFFSCCLQIAWAFKGSDAPVNFDMEFLTRPLKSYISEYVTKFVLGRGSHCLSIIICCLQEQKQGELKGVVSLDQTSKKNPVCETFFVALEERFRTEEAAGYYQKLAHKHNDYGKQLTYILSAHHWLHEDYFVAHQNVLPPPVPRAALLIQLQSVMQALSNWHTSIHKISEELKQCTIVVLQRLKWASGANPMVNELMKSFESISSSKAAEVEKEKERAAGALKHCCSVLNYEMLRFKTPKAIVSDEEFLNFLQQWEKVCMAERNVAHTVNQIEEALVELLDPEGKVERSWINNVTSLIDDMINQVHSDIDANEKSVTATRENLDFCAHKLRSFIATHHRISADIRNLLKSMLKYDDSDHNKALKEYLAKYKSFIDNVTELHGNVLSKDFTDVMVKRTIEQVDVSLAIIIEIYNDLFTFEKALSTTLSTSSSAANTDVGHRRMLRNQSENYSIEHPGSPVKKGL